METSTGNPAVTLEDIASIRRQLFRRWFRPMAVTLAKWAAFATLGAIALYLVLRWRYPSHVAGGVARISILSVFAIFIVPFAFFAAQMLRLDWRLMRRLDTMARRVRAGEAVRAGDIEL